MRDNEKINFDTNPTGFKTVELEAASEIEAHECALRKYRFILDALFNDLERKFGLEADSVFTEKVSLVLAIPLKNTCSGQAQSSSAHIVLSRTDMEELVRLLGSGMAPGLHGHMSCLDLECFHWNSSLPAPEDRIENVKGDFKE